VIVLVGVLQALLVHVLVLVSDPVVGVFVLVLDVRVVVLEMGVHVRLRAVGMLVGMCVGHRTLHRGAVSITDGPRLPGNSA
jgi:hypothetical protein